MPTTRYGGFNNPGEVIGLMARLGRRESRRLAAQGPILPRQWQYFASFAIILQHCNIPMARNVVARQYCRDRRVCV